MSDFKLITNSDVHTEQGTHRAQVINTTDISNFIDGSFDDNSIGSSRS